MILWFAKRYIAGEELDDAVRDIKELNLQGIGGILDALGEDITEKRDMQKAVTNYLSILDEIEQRKIITVISVKLSQLGLGIDYDFCKQHMKKIMRKARHTFVWIDMEGSRYTADTIHLYLELYKTYKNLGICIQSYLMRSKGDIEEIIKYKGKVRMVKGAYKEPPTIAFPKLRDVNEQFFELTRMLLKKKCFVQIATHDKRLIKRILEFIKKQNINKKYFEFAFLKGIRRKYRIQLVKEGYQIKVYVPYGKQWFPYFWRRVTERKENLFFVLKNLLLE